MVQSKALEVNLASYRVEVEIDPKYSVLQEAMSKYYGIMEGLNIFLSELSHPHKNWQFIVKEARGYSLDYFHLLKNHPKGGEAAALLTDVFIRAIENKKTDMEVKADAADNLLLFLQKIIKDADPGAGIEKFLPVINDAFHQIENFDDEYFFLFVKSYYQIKKLALLVVSCQLTVDGCQLSVVSRQSSVVGGQSSVVNRQLTTDNRPPTTDNGPQTTVNLTPLLIKYYRHSYNYWLNEADPLIWFERETGEMERKIPNESFKGISHAEIRKWNAELNEIEKNSHLERLLELPGYSEIVEVYRELPRKLLDAGAESGRGKAWKVIFLIHIMNVPGLSAIHEEALRDINRTLSWLISHGQRSLDIEKIIQKTFSIVRERTSEFPATALNCVLNMGKGVYETANSELINFFINSVIELGFQSPMINGVGNDWQIRVNPAHLQNIRTWLQLIELNPKCSTRLISYLIIHLSLCGVFIKDTDLFPRDITRLLNSDIEPVYNLVKQLTKLFPAYFNDIGAEGDLRDISTRIDEITHRKDRLIHFLRKQIHVESSNRVIGFIEAIFQFWTTREKYVLLPFVPPDIYDDIRTEGPYVDGVHRILSRLGENDLDIPDDFLTIGEDQLKKGISAILKPENGEKVSNEDVEKVKIAASLYKLLRQKYDLSSYSKIAVEIDSYLTFPDPDKLKEALTEATRPGGSLKRKIIRLLNYLELLKKLILSPESYEVREDIYKKRHFAVDIPSMYGSYHEMKFDALGLMFRIEALVNVLFEELVESTDLSLITKATFYEIFGRLWLFNRALKTDGISTTEIERQLDFLAHSIEVRGFTFTQYLDIFKGFAQAVKNIINDYFNNVHEANLNRILGQLSVDSCQLLQRATDNRQPTTGNQQPATGNRQPATGNRQPATGNRQPATGNRQLSTDYQHRVSENFSREMIAQALGLQQLDVFLTRILSTLFHQAEKLHKEHLHQLLIYDPGSAIRCINQKSDNTGIIYLGNKGFNLIRLKTYDLPVPSGFIVTTEVFRFREMIENYPPAARNFREQISNHIYAIEKETDKLFGDPAEPLLFSVRSGSSISQPGMMNTFLNVGINEEITEGIAARTGNPWFAWDSYRRFLQCYGMAYDLKRDDFDAIIAAFKDRWGILYKRNFTGEQMRTVALAYKKMINDSGVEIIEDPFEQLLLTIKRVFESWESSKATTYRRIMGISEDWGTAVTVQSMVFGNLSQHSGTGVFFTHNPRWSGDSLRLWGDFTIGNQGEDVVSGLVTTLPISLNQQDIEMRDTDTTLETHFPEIYKALRDWANDLIYKKGWSPQEMEFTFESPSVKDLYLLQTRDMGIRERTKVMTFEAINGEKVLGHGIGVGGGAMSGRVVFTVEEIDRWRAAEPKTSLILMRSDTVPDDIREIHAADGLLTARGGLTSHAAVVAHRLGKTCVVGCGNLVCNEKEKVGFFDQAVVESGDYISIDGREGSIYEGFMKIREV
ncbi:PEP/pyruvate-binding domain-containing protein [Desulfobacterales bacterium HSG2]|nr:PEP/pyruvate-binding domain-containing protein [Desulfobacterales bacterium HSG2]